MRGLLGTEVIDEVRPWPAERAAASSDETIGVMWHGGLLVRGDLRAERVPDETISVTATDIGRTWRVSKRADDFVVERLDAAASTPRLSVAGRADDLAPWLWCRTPTTQLEITGDIELIDVWNLSARI